MNKFWSNRSSRLMIIPVGTILETSNAHSISNPVTSAIPSPKAATGIQTVSALQYCSTLVTIYGLTLISTGADVVSTPSSPVAIAVMVPLLTAVKEASNGAVSSTPTEILSKKNST